MRSDAYRHTASHILAHLYRAGAAKSSSSAALERGVPPAIPVAAGRTVPGRSRRRPGPQPGSLHTSAGTPPRGGRPERGWGASMRRPNRGDPEWLAIALGVALTAATLALVAPSIL